MTTTTYVTYLLPGVMVPEQVTREIARRDPKAAARTAPEGSYAFTFSERTTARTPDGETLQGKPRALSGTYYIGGERLTETDLEAMGPRYAVLLENMRSNRWPAVVRCLHGNFQPLHAGDEIISAG